MNWRRTLRYSDYWTWFTEWLLAFGSKAAWPILIITTLYMGAELYPGVNLPAGLNFTVFLGQLFALDMGGMGLVSLARQARDEGNEEGAQAAGSFGRVLVGIVIASLITVGVKQFLSGIPALIHHSKGVDDSIMTTYIDPVILVVEFVLVIARVICAVLYGKVMHALKHEYNPQHPTPPELQWSLVGLAAQLQSEMQQAEAETERRLSEMQAQIRAVQSEIRQQIEQSENAILNEFRWKTENIASEITEQIKQELLVAMSGYTQMLDQLAALPTLMSQVEQTTTRQLQIAVQEVRHQVQQANQITPAQAIPTRTVAKIQALPRPAQHSPQSAFSEMEALANEKPASKSEYVRSLFTENPSVRTSEIKDRVTEKFGSGIADSTISEIRKEFVSSENQDRRFA